MDVSLFSCDLTAAVQTKVQRCGEDQDNWQHLHGGRWPQRGARSGEQSGEGQTEFRPSEPREAGAPPEASRAQMYHLQYEESMSAHMFEVYDYISVWPSRFILIFPTFGIDGAEWIDLIVFVVRINT